MEMASLDEQRQKATHRGGFLFVAVQRPVNGKGSSD
jgi:hypothetical protein